MIVAGVSTVVVEVGFNECALLAWALRLESVAVSFRVMIGGGGALWS